MIVENLRFRDHCRIWHQCNEESFDQARFPPIFGAPPQQATPNDCFGPNQYPHWQNSSNHQSQPPPSVSPVPTPMAPMAYRVHHPYPVHGEAQSWSSETRHHKASIGSSSANASGYPPRKSLIDTFVERNDDYWKSRVTIKIDVSHTDHSHIIGKQGRNTQMVMKDTGCHIHFPDANRNPDLEKSNMVSIAGPMQMVDKARRAIRDLAPLVITLEMRDSTEEAHVISEHPLVREVAAMYGLNTLVRSNRSSGTPFFVVRGSVHQTHYVREGILRLQQHFMNTTTATCSLALDILRPQQATVIGRHAANIRSISQRTGAVIHYPKNDMGQATTFFIRGTIDAILSARQHIVGCLPVSFSFEFEKRDVKYPRIEQMEHELEVSITVRTNRNGESTLVIVKGQERQATQIYAVRRRMLGGVFPDEPPVIASDYDFMRDFVGTGYIPSPNMDVPAGPGSLCLAREVNPGVFTFPSHQFGGAPYTPVSAPWYSTSEPLGADSSHRHFTYPTPAETSSDSSSYTRVSGEPSTDSDGGAHAPATDSEGTLAAARFDPVPEEAPLASSLLEAKKKIQAEDTTWKAPGAERSMGMDYDKQQVLASKAKREKPKGPRVPTDHWSGLGFSRSMPSAVAAAAAAKDYCTVGHEDSNSTQNGNKSDDSNEDDKIGPWTVTPACKSKKKFNATTYFDSGTVSMGAVSISDEDDVSVVLSRLHLAKYVDVFREQEVDMGTFLTMTDDDLKELGVNTFGARRKLLVIISELNECRRRGQ